MNAGQVLQLCAALVVLTAGVMLAAVGSLVPGVVLAIAGGAWLVRSVRRL
ncbi:hypothetical protein [Pseudonocardia sp. H11422]|nr:hypothetical protein [Pseudonocardia sp. H11422]